MEGKHKMVMLKEKNLHDQGLLLSVQKNQIGKQSHLQGFLWLVFKWKAKVLKVKWFLVDYLKFEMLV